MRVRYYAAPIFQVARFRRLDCGSFHQNPNCASSVVDKRGLSRPFSDPSKLNRVKPFLLPLAIAASLLVVFVPLPAPIMDLLLAANITVAVVILMTTLFVQTPLEFSIFPSLLLTTTLTRLVLNIATTRLILTRAADEGVDASSLRGTILPWDWLSLQSSCWFSSW